VPGLLQLVPELACPRWVAMRLLEGDARICEALRSGELAKLASEEGQTRRGHQPARPFDPALLDADGARSSAGEARG
ncbi:MAG: hypothetical protein ACE5I3_14040, partial [Phycisphaerae bacterium]